MPSVVLQNVEKALTNVIGPHRNLARELAEALCLSQESIYRRFRGETSFTLNEAWILQQNYGLSIDQLFGDNGKLGVDFKPIYTLNSRIESYLVSVYERFRSLSLEEDFMLYALASDVPLFRLFGYPHLTQFKLFYWNNLLEPSLCAQKFKFQNDYNFPICDEINALYNGNSVFEVWSKNTLNGTLNQFEYFADSGLFHNQDDIFELYREFCQLVEDLVYESDDSSISYHHHELGFNNNSFYVRTKKSEFLAIGINGINSLQTQDSRILNEYKVWLKGVMLKSLKVSRQSEKQKFKQSRFLKSRIIKSGKKRLSKRQYQELVELNPL